MVAEVFCMARVLLGCYLWWLWTVLLWCLLWLLGCCLLMLCSVSSLRGFILLFCAPAGEIVRLIIKAAAAHAPHRSLTGSSVQAGTT